MNDEISALPQQLESDAMLHEHILESMDNGVIALDFEGKIITFNAAATRILDISAEEAVGRYYPEVFFEYEGNDEFNDVLINVIYTRQTHLYRETAFVRKDGRSVPLAINSSLLKDKRGQEYGVVSVFSDLTEIKKREFLQDTLTRYVTKQVVELILDHPESIILDGEEREATVFFSDIRGFTTLSERMRPKDLVAMLREYFTLMVDAVFQYQGTVDKFIGDALMAIFGAPTPQPDHAERAVRTALEMKRMLIGFNQERVSVGQDPIRIGVGINTGHAVVGNIGSVQRLEYTAIGDAVNLASRLEGINKQYGTEIIISESTFRQLPDSILVRELDDVRVKGKHEPSKIYEVIGVQGELTDETESGYAHFRDGLTLYKQRQWDAAMREFQAALEMISADKPSQLYLDRCRAYKQNPPSDDWDGVFEMKSK